MCTTRHILCLLVFLSGMMYSGWTQRMPRQVIMKPKKYMQPFEGMRLSSEQGASSGKFWFVYGDINGIKATDSPGGGAAITKIEFGAVYAVVEEQGDYIRLAQDEAISYRGKLSPDAVEIGWVHKKDVLLWEHCLVAPEQGKLDRKVMILNNLRAISAIKEDEVDGGTVKFYQDPARTLPTEFSSGLFEIYFLYKVDKLNGSLLLGRSHAFQSSRESGVIGWVPESRVVKWDQRIALEPNWDETASQERQAQKHPARFFTNHSAALKYHAQKKADSEHIIWDDDPYEKRWIGEYRRFPILEGRLSDPVVRVGVMGDINTEHAKYSSLDMAQIQHTTSEKKAEARNVDVLFVIDASKSMEPYFEPVAEALNQSVQDILAFSGAVNQYRFGAVIYRDESEGKYTVESARLTSKHQEITRFLNKVPAESPQKNQHDTDLPEAVFYGLKNAIRGTGLSRNHTNVVILIGDCGNHNRGGKTAVSHKEILGLLNDYHCNMLVFQANRGNDPSYEAFRQQSQKLLEDLAFQKYAELKGDAVKANVELQTPQLRMESANPNFLRLEGGAVAGALLSPPGGQNLDPGQLSQEIKRLIRDTDKAHNQVMDAIDYLVIGGEDMDAVQQRPQTNSPYVSAFPASIMLFLQRSGFTADEMKAITSKSYQMFIEGHAPVHLKGHENPSFVPVLLINNSELGDILREMERFQVSANDQRQHLVDTWMEILRTHIGDVSRSQMESWSLEEITEKVYGLPTSSSLANTRLKDLMDPAIVDDYMINEYARRIYDKYTGLRRIFERSDDYPYKFISNDIPYYWISQELLP